MRAHKPTAVAVVGCGEIAQIMHLPHLREMDDRFRLLAVCDTDAEVLKSVAHRFGVENAHTDSRYILEDRAVEAVVIATPGDHAGLVEQALDAGKHVFVEKPLCYSVDDAHRIAERARRTGLTVMAGYSRIFDTAFDEFHRLVDEQPPGRFIASTAVLPDDYFYRAHHSVARCASPAADNTAAAEPTWPYLFEEVLHNLATHELYCLRRLFRSGFQLRSATPLLGRRGVHALWESEDGDTASMTLVVMTGLSGGYREEFHVSTPMSHTTLTYPSVYLKNTPATVRHSFSKGPHGPLRSQEYEGSYADPFKRELEHFADVLEERCPSRCSAEDAIHDIQMIAEIYDRAKKA
ncbi:Gfo/Idh/MocA family protein [Streptomyces sp. NEAU-W12]|uniref:Gfo/Idh/MocA family protein n=1 Tax=Streptomyces sp. NEAU-W12 TaxID=2994668 RepID=UPI00224B0E69|nr:Gfo/Idh/MocA family oxidoreductase [Streptomyces sp. NEAU-W12]MCX2926640.1 Gfo/Idh/MocA family oxidoreductase [Streptomyces sp. NEAU-W12]